MNDTPLNPVSTSSTEPTEASLTAVPTDAAATSRVPVNPDDLHDLFAGAGETSDEDPYAEMRRDPNYAALIKDLEAIAIAARELFATSDETPSDGLWDKIATQLPAKPDSE